jgi:hypothetical protein
MRPGDQSSLPLRLRYRRIPLPRLCSSPSDSVTRAARLISSVTLAPERTSPKSRTMPGLGINGTEKALKPVP